MPAHDGCERVCQIGMRIDSVELAGFDQGGDDAPVCGSCVVTSKECVLTVQSDGPDRSLYGIAIHFDTPITKEQHQAAPVFCDVFERFAQGRFGRYAGAMGGRFLHPSE